MLEAGSELAGYRVVRFLARGGMGAVYEAVQISLDRRVALKVISPELAAGEEFQARFRREARAAAAIDHPHILPVYETASTPDGVLFLVSRLVDGQDLGATLRARGRLEVHYVLTILDQVAQALDAAAANGLVHRDVKPANVLVEDRAGTPWAYLTDFGLARMTAVTAQLTGTGGVLGTADYMAPEQIRGEPVDGRTDVYALGCTLFHCLTGVAPYVRDNPTAVLFAHLNAPIPSVAEQVPELPPAVDRAVAWAMAKDREERAPRAGDVTRWLTAQLPLPPPPEEAPTVPGPPATPPAERMRLRHRAALHAAAYAPLFAGGYVLGRHL